ncbi:cytochrome c [Mesonia sp. K4-1]|uniref:c-type cytochrome n=1 Tax=Mesonia sp. K4-1 TaxID=2602760 RepID=UPI0011C73F20|nr:cytochrome c [Mesonia sp. K4-1]TXK75755.1 cytochrome c [Mesonia sp. K4-1]
MKSLFKIAGVTLMSLLAVSCFNEKDRNYQYFPNMYKSVGYETYGEYEVFEGSQEAKLPVEGTIPRGWMPYEYDNTTEGYDLAKAELKNPLPYTEDNVNEGKALYTIYCAICHGDKGDGKGTLAQREKILGIPAYDDAGRAITEGSVYHVMYYGINTMGSYAAQTNEKERWQIDHYVMDLKAQLEGKPKREPLTEDEAKQFDSSSENQMVNADEEMTNDAASSHENANREESSSLNEE